jgi:hypothetical protein
MRPLPWIICIPLALIAGCAVAPYESPAAHRASDGPAWTVKGYGETTDDARERALEKARDSVEEYLQKHFPNIGWQPTIQGLLAESVVRVDDAKQGDFAELKGYESTAHIDLRDANLAKLQVDVDQAREQSQASALYSRHLILGRILAAFVALFLIVGGYLRLEELTRGYYTTLLRVGAGAVMLLIAALVLLVRV